MSDIAPGLNELKELLAYLQNVTGYGAGPVESYPVEDDYYTEPMPEDQLQAIAEALAEAGVEETVAADIVAAASAAAAASATGGDAAAAASASASASASGLSLEELLEVFAANIEVNYVDNSVEINGDVKGDFTQQNETRVVEAEDGGIATGDYFDGQAQTGNGQQAGYDAYADNFTTGDHNTIASKEGIIGDENIDADDIYDSEFGEGDLTDNTTTTTNQHAHLDFDLKVGQDHEHGWKPEYDWKEEVCEEWEEKVDEWHKEVHYEDRHMDHDDYVDMD